MASGRLLQLGTPADLWRAPADEQVARFLGYEAFVVAREAPAALRDAVRAPADATLALPPGALVGPGASAGDATLTGMVLAVRTRRGSPTLHVAVPGIGEVTVATPAVGVLDLPAAGTRCGCASCGRRSSSSAADRPDAGGAPDLVAG